MKKILVSICLSAAPFLCQAAEPTTESIEKLLAASQTHKMVDQMIPQMENMMKTMADKAVDAQNLSPEESKKAKAESAAVTNKMMPILKDQLSWEKLEKIYIPIYRESFTQEEIDGLIAFYSSPAGKALVEKMPLVMQKSMLAMQQVIGPMMQQIQKAVAESAEELKHPAPAKQ